MEYFVHPSAYIDDGAKVGTGTKIWHFCHVMDSAKIGANVTLGQNVFVGANVVIGDNCKVQNNVSIFEGVTMENDVFCGPSMVFTNVDRPRSAYPLGNEAYLKTIVREGATIGANATIVCGTELGRFSFVGAGAVVTKNVPDYAVVYGVPAEIKGWVCHCGAELEMQANAARCSFCARFFTVDSATGRIHVEDNE